ncbi:MAG: GNAT family N-acetyltransferase [Defluviitaleaceae bacterium]|nr:GNAT family N-acetyltransferase [Defluviitaleaceae bacterium]
MEIRKLKPEENVYRKLMGSICFVGNPPEDGYAWLENPQDHTQDYDIAWGAFNETGQLVSGMVVYPAQLLINDTPTKAGLIGYVTTLPEARNSSSVRKIFEKVMINMYEDGVVYSLLYPFSYKFYRKFGYEHAYLRNRATFPISELSHYPYPDGVKAHGKDGPWADFAKVYEVFSKGKTLAMVRGEKQWQNMLNRDPHKNREFTYIHYNTQSQPDSYILYNYKRNNKNSNTLQIHELAWTSKAGLEAMLGFIHGMRSEYAEVSWVFPSSVDVHGIVGEAWSVEIARDTMIMNRTVNIPAALDLLKPPSAAGSVTIKVTDKFVETNTGTYKVTWEAGSLNAEKANGTPDMEVNVETLVQLTTGYLTPAQALYRQDVVIHSKMQELTALFPIQEHYLIEGF